MTLSEFKECLERNPIIAAARDNFFNDALASPTEIIFHLDSNLFTLEDRIKRTHDAGKKFFISFDLAKGIGKDEVGMEYLAKCGVDGMITTKGQLISLAKEAGIFSIQRNFALDSKGIKSIHKSLESHKPDAIEIIPGVIGKVIRHFADAEVPIIAGGLIETKAEITGALASGAFAVSTGKKELWNL